MHRTSTARISLPLFRSARAIVAGLSIDEALSNNWLDVWYQPRSTSGANASQVPKHWCGCIIHKQACCGRKITWRAR